MRETPTWPRLIVAGGILAGLSYGAYVAAAWRRYGHVKDHEHLRDRDPLLDRFMPIYEVREYHHIDISAPAPVTLAAAYEMDLQQPAVTRMIFKARELLLGSKPAPSVRPQGIVAQVKALGWGVLAELPGHEIVMGAVTKPWRADVVFRALPPDEFAAFSEPGYVKIAWTLRADEKGPGESTFRTETRAVATDPAARTKFRRYWACLSPGIILIRLLSLGPLKREAERRARKLAHELMNATSA